jgi:hypothetical protein
MSVPHIISYHNLLFDIQIHKIASPIKKFDFIHNNYFHLYFCWLSSPIIVADLCHVVWACCRNENVKNKNTFLWLVGRILQMACFRLATFCRTTWKHATLCVPCLYLKIVVSLFGGSCRIFVRRAENVPCENTTN